VVLFAFIAFGIFGLLIAQTIRHLVKRDPATAGASRRTAFAAFMWILITVAASVPLGVHAMLMAHSDPRANPWLAAPLLLLALPLHIGAGVWLYRWAMRRPI
jgi:hypothetical protein